MNLLRDDKESSTWEHQRWVGKSFDNDSAVACILGAVASTRAIVGDYYGNDGIFQQAMAKNKPQRELTQILTSE